MSQRDQDLTVSRELSPAAGVKSSGGGSGFTPELPDERLRRFLPIRVLVGTPPGANHPQCLIEHSFSMDWSADRCLLFWSGKAYSILGEHTLDAAKEIVAQQAEYARRKPDWRIEACDPLAEDSPIEVDWAAWLAALEFGSKFHKRNAPFVLSDAGLLADANGEYSDVQNEEIARAAIAKAHPSQPRDPPVAGESSRDDPKAKA